MFAETRARKRQAKSVSSFCDLGWNPNGFAGRCQSRYHVQHADDTQFYAYGDMVKEKTAPREFLRLCIMLLKRGGKTRIICLKNRRALITTAVSVLTYDVVTNLQGIDAGILAHEDNTTTYIYNQIRHLHARVPKELRPALGRANENEMRFGAKYQEEFEDGNLGLMSRISCRTAGGHYPFSGYTLRIAHFSEGPKWQGDKARHADIQMSVLNAIPAQGPSLVIDEGTANGKNNLFYERWTRAWDKKSSPDGIDWHPFFVKWTHDPSNYLPIPKDYEWEAWPRDDQDYERSLRANHGLADEQLLFRRFKVIEACNGDPSVFAQDYPLTPQEAFISHVASVFPQRVIDQQRKHVMRPLAHYQLRLLEGTNEEDATSGKVAWRGNDLVGTPDGGPGISSRL